MRQTVLLALIFIGFPLGLFGYYYALLDWVQDVQNGVYERNHIEAILETSALMIYTYGAVRFLRTKLLL